MKNLRDKDFDIFVGNLLDSYRQFCYWHYLSESFNKKTENKTFWLTIKLSLLRGSLSGLAKIFEKQNGRFPDVLSVYYLLDTQFSGFEVTIKKLKDVRDKVLMHSEIEPARDMDAFMRKISLTPKMIQDLFTKTIEITNTTRETYGISGDVFVMFNDAENKAKEEIANLINSDPSA